MQLRDLLDEVATGDEPPSRLSANEIYAAGVRRHRTAVVARIGTAAVLSVALVAAMIVFMAPARAPDPAEPVPTLQIRAIGGYDTGQLYVVVLPCLDFTCDPELRMTRDGGRTWTTRGTMADLDLPGTPWEIRVSGAGTVGLFGYGTAVGGPDRIGSTSVDKGRTFAQITTGNPVDAAPPDALVTCAYQQSGGCVVQVVDLDAGTAAALTTQPGLVVVQVTRAPDGAIWVLGRDDGAKRPAVGTSTDGGRTWSTHVFADAPEFTADYRLLAGEVSAVDGTVFAELTYASLAAPSQNANVAFRRRDSVWQRLDTDALGPGAMAVGASYLAADGTFVLQKLTAENVASPMTPVTPLMSPPTTPWSSGGPPWSSGPALPPSADPSDQGARIVAQFWSCPPDGTTYRRIDPPAGLSADPLTAVDRLPGGGYVAHGRSSAWVSADGRTWTRVVIR